MGKFVWHVKQSNNGISFIASDVPLIFGCLSVKNQDILLNPNIYMITDNIKDNLNDDFVKLKYQINYLSKLHETTSDDIKFSLLNAAHSVALVHFEKYLEQLFIIVTNEKYIHRNNNIKIKNITVNVKDFDREDEFAKELDIQKRELIILNFISCMYNSFLKNSLTEKITFINKSLSIQRSNDNDIDILLNSINTHKAVRNCAQHNHSQLTKDYIDQCDLKTLVNLIGEVKLGMKIEFKLETVENLHTNILKYSNIIMKYFIKLQQTRF